MKPEAVKIDLRPPVLVRTCALVSTTPLRDVGLLSIADYGFSILLISYSLLNILSLSTVRTVSDRSTLSL